MSEKYGYVQINTGNGKGKTTAAFGTSLRMLIRGKSVFFGQFIKGTDTAELAMPKYFPEFTIKQFGKGCFIMRKPDEEDIRMAHEGLKVAAEALKSGRYGLVVLDEVNVAVSVGLLTAAEVLDAVKNRAEGTEVIMTGRDAPSEFIEYADLVTEMKKVKHYFDEGISARKGIEY
ncbi:MAG: cob(I)yrinic acid a,c-diamide adenosyltransferase [Methanomicrobium sp.]|nr:cob(I)yrinic acid a,c-diamide adenosyltransferase [Methanomicrobium sp.]